MSRLSKIYHYSVVLVLFLIIVLPMAATFIYSISSSWSSNILPDGFSISHYKELLSDPRFFKSTFKLAFSMFCGDIFSYFIFVSGCILCKFLLFKFKKRNEFYICFTVCHCSYRA